MKNRHCLLCVWWVWLISLCAVAYAQPEVAPEATQQTVEAPEHPRPTVCSEGEHVWGLVREKKGGKWTVISAGAKGDLLFHKVPTEGMTPSPMRLPDGDPAVAANAQHLYLLLPDGGLAVLKQVQERGSNDTIWRWQLRATPVVDSGAKVHAICAGPEGLWLVVYGKLPQKKETIKPRSTSLDEMDPGLRVALGLFEEEQGGGEQTDDAYDNSEQGKQQTSVDDPAQAPVEGSAQQPRDGWFTIRVAGGVQTVVEMPQSQGARVYGAWQQNGKLCVAFSANNGIDINRMELSAESTCETSNYPFALESVSRISHLDGEMLAYATGEKGGVWAWRNDGWIEVVDQQALGLASQEVTWFAWQHGVALVQLYDIFAEQDTFGRGVWVDVQGGEVKPLELTSEQLPLSVRRVLQVLEIFSMLTAISIVIVGWRLGMARLIPNFPPNISPVGLFGRFAAAMIDLLPCLATVAILAKTSPGNIMGAWPQLLRSTTWQEFWLLLAVLVLTSLHTGVSEVIWGTTLGKRLLRMRVVDMQGKRPTRMQLCIRGLIRMVEWINPMLALILIFTPARQRLGDIMARTTVVREIEPLINKEDENP